MKQYKVKKNNKQYHVFAEDELSAVKKLRDALKSKYYFIPDDSYGQHGTNIYELLLTKEEAQKIKETRMYNGERGFLTASYYSALAYVQDSATTLNDSWIGQKVETDLGEGKVIDYIEKEFEKERKVVRIWKVKLDKSGRIVKTNRIRFNGYYYDSDIKDAGVPQEELAQKNYEKLKSQIEELDKELDRNDNNPNFNNTDIVKQLEKLNKQLAELKKQFGYALKDSEVELDDGYLGMSSSQENDLRKYAKRYGYDMQEVYDSINSKIKRERMSLADAIEEVKESMVNEKSLYDSAVRDSIKEGETYTNKNGVQVKILGINTDVTGKKYATYRIKNDTYNHPIENVENMLKANYYTKDSAIKDAEELPHISREKWNKIPSDYKTKDPVTGKRQAFAGSLGIAPGGTTLLTEGKHFIIDEITSKRDSVIKDGYPKLDSRQEQELRKYAQRFSYEMEEVYDGLNSRVNREGMPVDKAVEDLKETMVAQKSLYDSSVKDSYIYADLGQDYHKNADDIRKKGLKVSYMGRSNGFGMYGKIEGTRKQLERLQELGYFEDEIIHDAGINDSKPEPEFAAKGKWEWDEVKGDWYDTGAKMYYEELRRLNGEHLNDASGDKYTFKLDRKKNDYDEYIVKCFKNGKYDEAGTYYTDDYEDALGTLKALAQRSGLTVRQQGSVYIADEDVLKYHRIGGYLGKYDPKGLEDIKKASKYGIDARLEKGNNDYQLVLHGSGDKIKEFLNKQLRVTDSFSVGEKVRFKGDYGGLIPGKIVKKLSEAEKREKAPGHFNPDAGDYYEIETESKHLGKSRYIIWERKIERDNAIKDSAIRDSYVVLRKDEAFEESGAKSVARKYNLQVKMDGYKNIFSGKEEDIIRMLYDYFKPQYAGQIELRIKDSAIKDPNNINDLETRTIKTKLWNPDFYLEREPNFNEVKEGIRKILKNSGLEATWIELSVFNSYVTFRPTDKRLDNAPLKKVLNDLLKHINKDLHVEKLVCSGGQFKFTIEGFEYLLDKYKVFKDSTIKDSNNINESVLQDNDWGTLDPFIPHRNTKTFFSEKEAIRFAKSLGKEYGIKSGRDNFNQNQFIVCWDNDINIDDPEFVEDDMWGLVKDPKEEKYHYYLVTVLEQSEKWGDDEVSYYVKAENENEAKQKVKSKTSDKIIRVREGNYSEYLKFKRTGQVIDSSIGDAVEDDIDTQQYFTDAVTKAENVGKFTLWKDEEGNYYLDATISRSGKRLQNLKTKDINEARRIAKEQLEFIEDKSVFSEETMNSVQEGIEKDYESMDNRLEELHDSNKCVICGKEIQGYGNNAEPVKKGMCCDKCNKEVVIPARIAKYAQKYKETFTDK